MNQAPKHVDDAPEPPSSERPASRWRAGYVTGTEAAAKLCEAEASSWIGGVAEALGKMARRIRSLDQVPAQETPASSLWMQTASGRKFVIADPDPDAIVIEDIAHALSLICRFGGHCREFYCVAQHSVLVCNYVRDVLHGSPNDVRWALLHDASEAYVGDVVWPLKRAPEMSEYKQIEKRIQALIARKFDLVGDEPSCVKHADLVIMATEKRDLLADGPGREDGAHREAQAAREQLGQWYTRPSGWEQRSSIMLPDEIIPWAPSAARTAFLNLWWRLR